MKFLILSFVLFSLLGCQGSVHPTKVDASNYIKNKTHYQDPGAAFSLVNSQVNLSNSGVEYAIDLGIYSGYQSGELTLSVSASKGLELVDGETVIEQALSESVLTFPYTVMASEIGRYYLYANAEVKDSNGRMSFRSLTLIIQVGESTTTTKTVINGISQKTTEKTTSDKTISMSLEETITY